MLFKKLIRTAWMYKAQFISMILMVAIGIGILVGFNAEWKTIEVNTNKFFTETGLADYTIYNMDSSKMYNFSLSDINQINGIDEVDSATRYLSLNVNVDKFFEKDKESLLNINVIEKYGEPTSLYFVEGDEYSDNSKGIFLSDQYAAKHRLKLHDKISFSITVYNHIFNFNDIEIVGLVKQSEFLICVDGKDQLMPDYSVYGFAFITPALLKEVAGIEYYNQIKIKSSASQSILAEKINNIFNDTKILITTKNESVSYAQSRGEMDEGKTMGSFLPILFILIAVLTMVTTMHRITNNERTQIGILQALGFKNRKILFHYLSYGLFIGALSGVIGIALGFVVCYMIMNPNGTMGTYFDMPYWRMSLPWFTFPLIILIIAFLVLVTFLSVNKTLTTQAAETLKGTTNKKVRNIAIEKTKIWNKLSFTNKWNIRDVFRNKSRSLMTIAGIVGCMVLLVAGLGMKDSMTDFLNILDEKICNYETAITIVDNTPERDVENYISNTLKKADYVSTKAVLFNSDKNIRNLEIYNNLNGFIQLIDENNNILKMRNDGAYVCLNLESSGYRIGDLVKVYEYGSNSYVEVKIIGIVRSVLSEGMYMTTEYAKSIGLNYAISTVYTDVLKKDIDNNNPIISSVKSQNELMDTYDTFMEIMNNMIYILEIAAVSLAAIVLYNLGIMSYMERYHELSTLKVLGFKDKQISRILVSQNAVLTIIAMIIGFPLGIISLKVMLATLASEYEIKLFLGILTYSVSIILTLSVSILVSLVVANKNKKINMVESLKNAD